MNLLEGDPVLATELADPSLATSLSMGSHSSASWRCSNGHEWDATVTNRQRGGNRGASGTGCPYCSGLRAIIGLDDIATTHPEIAAELVDGELATRMKAGSGKKVSWRCAAAGHEWGARIEQRCVRGNGCPYCNGTRIVVGVTDLFTTHPSIAKELVDQVLGYELSFGSSRIVEWQCALRHRWMSSVANRTNGSGCHACTGWRTDVGFNDLATTHPEIAAQLVEKELATKISRGSRLSCRWECAEGHQWNAAVSTRTKGHDCPTCYRTGYRQDENEARLYLILPPGKHPIGYGKVHSQQRYEYAMTTCYEGCQPLAYAVGTGRSVSDAESCINVIKGRPTGKIERLRRESLERSQASIDLWEQTAQAYGLEVTWLVNRGSITLEHTVKPRAHAELDFCSCAPDGLNRHDSKSSCCKRARDEATTIIAASHYLGCGPRATIHYFTWRVNGEVKAIMTLGTGSNSNGGKSLATYSGVRALELTRLWASPDLDMTLSSFISKCFNSIDYPLFVYSYADAAEGHTGGVYRACSFNYAGWSDMTRSQPLRKQPDRPTPFSEWPVVSAKHRYWKLIGVNGKRRSEALEAVGWQTYDHRILGFAPAGSHLRISSRQSSLAKIAPR